MKFCSAVLLVVVFLPSLVTFCAAYQECPPDSQDKGPSCNATIFFGQCGSILSPQKDKWCTWDGQDLCCANHAEDCCKQPVMSLAMIAFLVVVGPLLCCGLLKFYIRSRTPRNRADTESQPAEPAPAISQEDFLKALKRLKIKAHGPKSRSRSSSTAERPSSSSTPTEADGTDYNKDCIICFANPRRVILPCGHCQLCEECAGSFRSSQRQCPSCRKRFGTYAVVVSRCPSYVDLEDVLDAAELAPAAPPVTPAPLSGVRDARRTSTQSSLSDAELGRVRVLLEGVDYGDDGDGNTGDGNDSGDSDESDLAIDIDRESQCSTQE